MITSLATPLASARMVVVLVAAMLPVGRLAAQTGSPAPVSIDADGTVHVPAHVVPPSDFLSSEGRAYLQNHLNPDPSLFRAGEPDNGIPPLIAGYLKRQQEVFALERRETTIGGVHAYDYIPKSAFPRSISGAY